MASTDRDYTIQVTEDSDTQATFVVEPLERGYGITLGNTLRRILMTSIPGAAIASIKIDGVQHEFSTIDGVQEYLDFQEETDCQFTIKPLSSFDDKGMFEKVRESFPDTYFLEEGDYNIYFMPDNTATDCFM